MKLEALLFRSGGVRKLTVHFFIATYGVRILVARGQRRAICAHGFEECQDATMLSPCAPRDYAPSSPEQQDQQRQQNNTIKASKHTTSHQVGNNGHSR